LVLEGFSKTGTISIVENGNVAEKLSYSYSIRQDNKNSRTLQSLSTNASISMKGPDGKYYTEFQLFYDYYGDTNYGDKWITAAYKKQNTGFSSKYVKVIDSVACLQYLVLSSLTSLL
jgi:hypothetical protein